MSKLSSLLVTNLLNVPVWAQLQVGGGGYRTDSEERKHTEKMITLTRVLVIVGVLTLIGLGIQICLWWIRR